MCVKFSVGLCQCTHVYVHMYVLVCMCSPSSVCLCHCQYVQVGNGGQLCACVEGPGCPPDFSWELQSSMPSAENNKSKPPSS